jgi:hypothetical protein
MWHNRPPVTVEQILAWADAHKARTGHWPNKTSGPVKAGYLGDNWLKMDNALKLGLRGLDGGTTLAKLLVEVRGVRSPRYLPELSEEIILAWADRYYQQTGDWPNDQCAEVVGEKGEDWHNIDAALRQGLRGLPGGSSLASLFHAHGRRANRLSVTRLTVENILGWADAHHARMGNWPKMNSGEIPSTEGDTWAAVQTALHLGTRGLPGGSSLPQLLAEHRGVRNKSDLPRLTLKQIRMWAKAHKLCTGRLPVPESGTIPDSGGETWKGVDVALMQGLRGLRGGSSLGRLLGKKKSTRGREDL